MNNSHGKTITIFLVLAMLILTAATSIGFFLYHKEKQQRITVEEERDAILANEMKLQADLKESKHQLTVLQDKNKAADDKINDLMDEIELNEGVSKEIKLENSTLKESLEAVKKDKLKAQDEMEEASRKFKQIQELLKIEQDKSSALQVTVGQLEKSKSQADVEIQNIKSDLKAYNQGVPKTQIDSEATVPVNGLKKNKVNLDKIVVNSAEAIRGRVLSVDKEAEFLVCNLGLKQGIKSADVLAIYRGEEYLGDVRVSRVQEELSAADIIPPFSSRKVRKNDTVLFNK